MGISRFFSSKQQDVYGALTENYIANEFTSYGLPLNYYTFSNIISKKTALQEYSFSYILI